MTTTTTIHDKIDEDGERIETDPVCGMELRRADAAASMAWNGELFFFCSDACHAKFAREPDRYRVSCVEVE